MKKNPSKFHSSPPQKILDDDLLNKAVKLERETAYPLLDQNQQRYENWI
jgi:hypothetical protein